MARDFWRQALQSQYFTAPPTSTGVPASPLNCSRVLETFWTHSKSMKSRSTTEDKAPPVPAIGQVSRPWLEHASVARHRQVGMHRVAVTGRGHRSLPAG